MDNEPHTKFETFWYFPKNFRRLWRAYVSARTIVTGYGNVKRVKMLGARTRYYYNVAWNDTNENKSTHVNFTQRNIN